MEKQNVHLALVQIDSSTCIASCPAYEVEVDDLVEFDTGNGLKIGKVVDRFFCVKDEQEYNFVAKLGDIFPAVNIWHHGWGVENN